MCVMMTGDAQLTPSNNYNKNRSLSMSRQIHYICTHHGLHLMIIYDKKTFAKKRLGQEAHTGDCLEDAVSRGED